MTNKNYNFKKDKLIKEFIETKRKKTTKKTFISYLITFFKTIDKTPKEFLELDETNIKRNIK